MFNPKVVEPAMRKFWKQINLLKLLEEQNAKGKGFWFLDGPPYANFIPHVGHIKNTVFKDLYIRLAFMKGQNVYFRPGFDTHGLPVENKVEKELDLKSKKDIEKLGVNEFVKTCKKLAATYKDLWMEVYDVLGSWYSWREPYLTYDNSYVESGWWTFKQYWEKDWLYEGEKPVYWCPHCETALAGYEVTDSYAMVSDPAVYVKFKLKEQDAYLLVYTTTPWTLLSNVAIAVHPEEMYVKVDTGDEKVIIAKPLLHKLDEFEVSHTVLEEFKGKDMQGWEYEPLIDIPKQAEIVSHPNSHKVYMSYQMLKSHVASKIAMKKETVEEGEGFGHFVTMDDGTGLVHVAPGHGKTDNEFGQKYNLPAVSPLDDQCVYTEGTGQFEGKFCKGADPEIIDWMKEHNKLLYYAQIQHKYPLCWRCKSKLIFRLSHQWFIKVEPIKDLMLKENEKVNWQPDFAGERFHNWVADAEDWNVSRQRYWGIPMPIWRCECGENKVVGSVEELKKDAVEAVPEDFDLHTASSIHLKCNCGKHMSRVPDIADVWFDSGIAPWASLGYPYENKDIFDKQFPISRINESQDQIRGWFYYLMFQSTAMFDKAPYETVSMPGWVVDAKGEKMSKSVGNVLWAKETLEDVGADVLRFYFMWDIAPYDLHKFNLEIAKKEVPKILNIFWNLHNLLLNSSYQAGSVEAKSVEDKWLLSRLHSVVDSYTTKTESFELHIAQREIGEFIVNDVSRWYVQLVRDRMETDSTPLTILNEVVLTLCRLLVPVTPHLSEQVYQNMKEKNSGLAESVHLAGWPTADKKHIDDALEETMGVVQRVVPAVLSAREKAKISGRWPIKEVVVTSKDKKVLDSVNVMQDLIKVQANVKSVVVKDDLDDVAVTVGANRGRLGKDFGDLQPKIVAKIEDVGSVLADHFDAETKYETEIEGNRIILVKDHLEITREVPEPYVGVEFKGGVAYLDKTRNDELDAEGYAREVMRHIQQLRKNSGMQKAQRVKLSIKCDKELQAHLAAWKDQIEQKVGAETLVFEKVIGEHRVEAKVKDYSLEIGIDLV